MYCGVRERYRYEIVGVSDNLDSLFNYVVIMELEMMRVAAPHIGVEPCAGAKTDVMDGTNPPGN